MTQVRIVSHNNGASARALATALGNSQLLSRQQPTPLRRFVRDALVVNMGCTELNFAPDMNMPTAVQFASDKMLAFQLMQDARVRVVPFGASPFDVIELCPEYTYEGNRTKTIVARTLTRASEGRGIVMVDCAVDGTARTEVPNAPLYTAYIPKHTELRVHVVLGTVIDVTQKLKRAGDETPSSRIRNSDNGYVFTRGQLDTSEPWYTEACIQATRAVQCLGLDFGAVDIVVQSNQARTVYVLEVNTAPGMEGTTLEAYTRAFQRVADGNFIEGLTVPQAAPPVSVPVPPAAPTPPPVRRDPALTLQQADAIMAKLNPLREHAPNNKSETEALYEEVSELYELLSEILGELDGQN